MPKKVSVIRNAKETFISTGTSFLPNTGATTTNPINLAKINNPAPTEALNSG